MNKQVFTKDGSTFSNLSVSDLRDEFQNEHLAAGKVLADADQHGITPERREKLNTHYGRMDAIKAELDKRNADAARAFTDGKVSMPAEPKGMAEYQYATANRSTDIAPLSPRDSFAAAINAPAVTFGLGDYCRAMVLGPRNDAERFALTQNSDSAGGFKVPPALSAQAIDSTRTNSLFVQAGATTVALTDYRNRIARLTDNANPGFRDENASVVTTMTFEGVEFSLKTIAVTVKIARELLEDALNVNEAVQTEFAIAFANELDRVCGWGAGGTEPLGIKGTSNIQSVASATNGDSLATAKYGKLLDGLYQLHLKGTQPNAVVISPREMKTLNGLADSTGQPLAAPAALAALKYCVSPSTPINETQGTANNASTIIMGDMSKLYIGIRSGLTIEVLKERYADTFEYAFQGSLRVDTAVVRPKAFVKMLGILP